MSYLVKGQSDVTAKAAFAQELERRGYDNVCITKDPADITAERDGEKYYFEIKYTQRKKVYFGGATLTEWKAAITEKNYMFVVVILRDGEWIFHEYTTEEFMKFCTIPPFKVYFTVPVGGEKAVYTEKCTKSKRLLPSNLTKMIDFYYNLVG